LRRNRGHCRRALIISAVSDEQDLRRYIRLLRDQWRLAAGIIVVCVLVAVAVALAQPARYRATSSLLFLPAQAPSLNTQTNADPARSIATLSGLAGTQVVLANAASASHIPLKTLRDSVHSTASINGDLIDVAATAPSGAKAAARANAVANALVRVRKTEAQNAVRSAITELRQQIATLGKKSANAGAVATARGSLAQQQSLLALTKGDVNVVQPATVPTAAASPRPSLNAAIGFLIGLLAAALVLLARDRIDRKPRTGVDLEKLWQLPVLGAIQEIETNGQVPPATVAAYRMLRSNLLLRSEGDLPRLLLITSAIEGEGKSAVAANLARSLAAGGRRVVAVSADLGTPTLQQHMAIASSAGIAEVLEDDVYPTDAVTRVPLTDQDASGTGLLDLLASDSRSDASTSLVSTAMEDLLGDLQDEYEIVVIDAPAILPASETVLLARNPGVQMLIVATIGGAQSRDIERARERLALARIEPIGLVVCGADSE
jgi:Mrp family chromosome partitioning ATPase/capsular polysaccharide biosynthesis protein